MSAASSSSSQRSKGSGNGAKSSTSGIRKPPPLKRLSDNTQLRTSATAKRQAAAAPRSGVPRVSKEKASTSVSHPSITKNPGGAGRKNPEKTAAQKSGSVTLEGTNNSGDASSAPASVPAAASTAGGIACAASLSPSVMEFKPYFQELDILIEYKLVCHYMVREGIYVVPSLKSGRVWHGLVCLHAGPFRGGLFRFDVFFTDRFPHEPPMLKFVSHVFHPQVDATGVLNISTAFPDWRAQRDHVWHVLRYMKKVLCSLDTWQPINEKATKTIHESMDAYNAQAQTCVHQSLQDVLEAGASTEDDGNFLKYFDIADDLLPGVKQLIGSQSTYRALSNSAGSTAILDLAERFSQMFAKHMTAPKRQPAVQKPVSSSPDKPTTSSSVPSSSKKSRSGTPSRAQSAAQRTRRKSPAVPSTSVAI